MFMNTLVLLNMMLDRKCIKLGWDIHKMFSKNSSYRMKNLIKAGLNVIKNDRIVKHEGMYIVNSFIPPLNSEAYRSIVMAVRERVRKFYEPYRGQTESSNFHIHIGNIQVHV